jgi:gluconokinase
VSTTIVLMGVAGAGKSSVAGALRRSLGWPFAEGDDFHPESNVAKMRSGVPLDDDDRRPWLAAIASWVGEQESAGRDCIVTCSALKAAYRQALRDGHPSIWFAHLTAPREVIGSRLDARVGHFMPPNLLTSQLDELEPLRTGEPGVTVPTADSAEDTAAAIEGLLRAEGRVR